MTDDDDDDLKREKDALADAIVDGIADIVDTESEKFLKILSEITGRDDPFSQPVTDEEWNLAGLRYNRQCYDARPEHLRAKFLQRAAPEVLRNAGYSEKDIQNLRNAPEEAAARAKAILEARPN